MFRLNPAEVRRQFKRLGLKNVKVDVINAEEIAVRLEDGREIVLHTPQALLIRMQGNAVMLQAVSSTIEEREYGGEATGQDISEDDVRLVAEQAGVSLEEARNALKEAGGDIAAAIMLIEERRKAS
ncbi:MAG: NagC family transcriptional regulator [Hyperthermus sp.]|nr:MAG: NagC family transcriptional regulator [Hyperthermus sp.]